MLLTHLNTNKGGKLEGRKVEGSNGQFIPKSLILKYIELKL